MPNIFFKKIVLAFTLFALFLPPYISNGAMLSDSYIIYENIHHDFDGPVISAISSSVAGLQVTVTWTTNVIADSFVIYGTDAAVPLATSLERGTSLKNTVNHSVVMSRLAPNTTYYYKVKSTRVNGGTSISSAINSFSIGGDPDVAVAPPAPVSAGGGTIIIDKTDKIAPTFTELKSEVLSSKSVKITWKTNENSTSFVEYGKTDAFGSVFGAWDTSLLHEVTLVNLDPGAAYQYRALSSDSWGNLGRSEILSFTLLPEEKDEPEDLDESETPDPETPDPAEPNIIDTAKENIVTFIRNIFPELVNDQITEDQLKSVSGYDELSDLVAAPIITGEPRVVVEANKATISWVTNTEANSQIAYAPENRYNPNAKEPYYQIVGNAEERVRNHSVEIYGLTADTVYHYQIRSRPRIGPAALSRDYTFATSLETLTIVSFFSQIISDEEAVFKWVTNKDSDSILKISPYENNVLATEKQKIFKDNKQTVIHEINVKELEPGVYYDVEMQSTDTEGNQAMETLIRFTTNQEDLPPIISQVKAESTVFLDRSNKTQTILSWITNEPSTSRVYYQEGVHRGQEELKDSTDFNSNYTKEHIMVITKFKPGIVYSFRVESIDSGGSIALSQVHTFMTAKQKESIIQIIIAIFENTFSWVKKLM